MKIGLTYTGNDEKQQYYFDWLNKGGISNLELVTLFPDKPYPVINEFQGLVFTGGIDVHPSFYNKADDYPNAPREFNRARDEFEKNLYQDAVKVGMPVLGICRGMQLINVLNGGTLTQDLGETGNTRHRAIPNDKAHEVNVEPGTLLMQVIAPVTIPGQSKNKVNSAHHQVIDELGKGLRISAVSDDAHPEALEWSNPSGKGFMLCVQWHPERMFRFNLGETPASANIRQRFLDEVVKFENDSDR